MTNINTFQGDVFIHEYIKHSGDDNNLFGFSGTDTFKIATAGVDRLTVDSGGSVTLGANMVIPDYIYHTGDVDTYFGFSGDGFFEIRTDGAVRMTVGNGGQVDLTGYLRIPNYIYHVDDADTYFGFSGADTIVMRTAGTDRITIASNGEVTFGLNVYIPTYIYHSGNATTYFGFNAANSWLVRTNGVDRINVNSAGNVTIGVNIYIPDYIYHTGDTNTYFGFSGADTIVLRTGGTNRLTINNSAVAVAGTLTATKLVTPLIEYGGALTLGSAHNYATDVRGGGTVKFTIDNVQRGVFNTSGLKFQNGGTHLNYFNYTSNGGAWGTVGQNGTGFNINGGISYHRVGNCVSMMARKVQFYAQGNFYMRHTIPAAFRPNGSNSLGTSAILPWVTRVTTNSSNQGMAYCQDAYIYHVGNYQGAHFAAGGGTQHTFDAHQAVWTI
jgi:hypothetical protein